jgi:hypothetical protein
MKSDCLAEPPNASSEALEQADEAIREYNTNSHYYLWGANELFHALIRDSHIDNSSKYSSKGPGGIFGDFYRNLDNYAYAPNHYRNFGCKESEEEGGGDYSREASVNRTGVLSSSGQNSTLAEANVTTSNSSSGNAQLAIQRLILRGHPQVVNRTIAFRRALENFSRDSSAQREGQGLEGRGAEKSESFLQHVPFAIAPRYGFFFFFFFFLNFFLLPIMTTTIVFVMRVLCLVLVMDLIYFFLIRLFTASDVYYLRHAKSLEFNSLFLCNLPSRFAELKNLGKLFCYHCLSLFILYFELSMANFLASLNLSNCKFIAFPSSLLYLANLTYLNFR